MRAIKTGESSFTLEFESEEELRAEHSANLAIGGLQLPGIAPSGPRGGESLLQARAVALLPTGVALMIESDTRGLLEALLEDRGQRTADPGPRTGDEHPAEIPSEAGSETSRLLDDLLASRPEATPGQNETSERTDRPDRNLQSSWDRIRSLSQMEKILLAVKAERSERAQLVQDNDPRVLLSLLKNPRLTIDEVTRIAKSTFLTYQIAEVIVKTGPWMANLELRVALIHNPKTPAQFALRILPTLPEADVRAIARSSPSTALKQAALRRLQGT